jgi:hypothetical protein
MGTTSVDNVLMSKYLQRGVVRQRNSVTLASWSSYTASLAIPEPATADWIRQRIVAETIPLQLDSYTSQTMAYFLQDPGTASDILQFISEDNDTTTEETLSATNQTICGTFMSRFAQSTVTSQQISDWCVNNNVPVPSVAEEGTQAKTAARRR